MPLDLTPQKPPYYDTSDITPIPQIQPKYKYAALITQVGSNAPTAIILGNSLSGPIVWTRNTTGQYQGDLTAAFTLNKTAPLAQEQNNAGSTLLFRVNANTIALQTAVGGAYLDNLLNNTYIEINIYE